MRAVITKKKQTVGGTRLTGESRKEEKRRRSGADPRRVGSGPDEPRSKEEEALFRLGGFGGTWGHGGGLAAGFGFNFS